MNKVVFLDRDGTINIDKDYLYKIEDFEYLPGAVEGLRALQDLGYLLIVVTNQSGIGRGYYTEEDYKIIDSWLKDDLELKGVHISASYYCPHLSDAVVEKYRCECECRKPKTGLFWQAQKDFNIDMSRSIAIGDKERDLAICNEAPVRGILLGRDAVDWDDVVCKVKSWQ
ncbi:D-glycero-D-manno-heptose 1,7-bisphosphate phosphatase [Pseudobutyrivibrio sp. 49]|uniref:D-glycero-alpha-D-manno-heptose-1,7-bisphosphate 7-phosphatase n=1 Tax=Pseudobutyrivibrio sp. 49 TaxID=1855344 RepID=UPI000892377B|nr:HAD family hydrolase [Pseudobutyrivibrio sp. 49]SDH91928.1 D-glycero-D-manno-heptose 1,7-bisphosphate phosphatase [Pseudobutyrivibrio sp. 49]